MSHLDDRLAALVDGEVSHDERDRALAHVATCNDCRAALEAERSTKRVMACLSDPVLPAGLAERLLALPGSVEPDSRPRRRLRPVRRRPVTAAPLEPHAHRHDGRPSGRAGAHPAATTTSRRTRRRTVRFSGGLVGAAVAAFGATFVLGAAPEPAGVPVLPPVNTFSVEHARSGGGLPFDSPAVTAVETGAGAAAAGGGAAAETLGGAYDRLVATVQTLPGASTASLAGIVPPLPAVVSPTSADPTPAEPTPGDPTPAQTSPLAPFGPPSGGDSASGTRAGSPTSWITPVRAPRQ